MGKFNVYSAETSISEWMKEFKETKEENIDIEYDDYCVEYVLDYDYE
jgi:hypothetical protein